jgi:ABC-type nickel/cobalt efflux system permease component RcnA
MKEFKNMKDNKSTAGGIGFSGLLTIAFIVLKLCKVIEWSWWWVLSPLWIGVGLAVAILVIVIIMAVIKAAIE